MEISKSYIETMSRDLDKILGNLKSLIIDNLESLLKNEKEKPDFVENIDRKELMYPKEFRDRFKFISHNTIYEYIRDKVIPGYYKNGFIAFHPEHLIKAVITLKPYRIINNLYSTASFIPELKEMVDRLSQD